MPNHFLFLFSVNMGRLLSWGGLSKIPTEEKIDLLFDILIPASRLRAINGNTREELKKIISYRKEIENLIENSDLESYQKSEYFHRLRFFELRPEISD